MNFKIICFLALGAFLIQSTIAADVCRALVIDGDNDFGAYQAGAISTLLNKLPAGEAQWDVISGVSVGALNAAGLAQFPKGEEKQMSEWLLQFWNKLNMDDVYSSWTPGGINHGIHYGAGVFDGSNFQVHLEKNIQLPPRRNISLLTCNATTGEFFRADQNSNLTQIRDIVRSSVSETFVLPYLMQKINATYFNTYLDGSTCQRADISGAIQRCREIVNNDDSKIHLTVVYSDNEKILSYSSSGSAFDLYHRKNQIQQIRRWYREVVVAKETFTQVNFDYVVVPSGALKRSSYPFFYDFTQNYNNTDMAYKSILIQEGEKDAQDAITAGKNAFETLYTQAVNQEKIDNDIAIQKITTNILSSTGIVTEL